MDLAWWLPGCVTLGQAPDVSRLLLGPGQVAEEPLGGRGSRGPAGNALREHDRRCHGDDPCCERRGPLQQLQVRRCTDRGSSGRGSTERTSTRYQTPSWGSGPEGRPAGCPRSLIRPPPLTVPDSRPAPGHVLEVRPPPSRSSTNDRLINPSPCVCQEAAGCGPRAESTQAPASPGGASAEPQVLLPRTGAGGGRCSWWRP